MEKLPIHTPPEHERERAVRRQKGKSILKSSREFLHLSEEKRRRRENQLIQDTVEISMRVKGTRYTITSLRLMILIALFDRN